jgi:hypothetical protein
MKVFPKFSVPLVSSCVQFLFVSEVPKYLNFARFSKDLLPFFML